MLKKIKRSLVRTRLAVHTTLFLQALGFGVGPTALYKVEKIKSAQRFFKLNTFVETGTYLGTTLIAVANNFTKLYSVELSNDLAEEAIKYFSNNKRVIVTKGDSGICLREIVNQNKDRKLFWLDAHYSGGVTATSQEFGHTPISKELEIIFSVWVADSVILIDDARLFDGTDNYPTIADLKKYVFTKYPDLRVFNNEDIIHIF